MKKYSWFIIFLLLSFFFFSQLQEKCSSFSGNEKINFTSEAEKNCFTFISNSLYHEGAVYTNFLEEEHHPDYAAGKEILSESQGLLLLYADSCQNKALFDEAFHFIKKYLDTKKIISYRYNPITKKRYSVNAAVDDMRIGKALFSAEKTFSNSSYRKKADAIAKQLFKTNVKNNYLYDFYDEKLKKTNNSFTLCYADFVFMKEASTKIPQWKKVYDNMLSIVSNGYISDVFPFYQKRYVYKSKRYEIDENKINMIESLLTVYHLAQIGKCPKQTQEFLLQKIREDAIYSYYTIDGVPASSEQSTAVYALCASIGNILEDEELYEKSIEKMCTLQVTNPDSSIFGAFGDENTLETYSYDNLMALLAFRRGDL